MANESDVLEIDRRFWRRGGDHYISGQGENKSAKGDGPTKLLNEFDQMCCLGFDALAHGLTREQILGCDYPADVTGFYEGAVPESYQESRGDSTDDGDPVTAAISANDDAALDEAERERRVRAALIELGWRDVVFTN